MLDAEMVLETNSSYVTFTMTPTVSIFIMTYNFASYIREAVMSVLKQETSIPFELIIIDDASTDGTQDVLASLPHDPRVKIHIHKANQGCVRTTNEGFSLARGEYIARLDGDDRYRNNFIKTAVGTLQLNKDVGMFYADVSTIDGKGNQIEERSSIVTPWKTHGGNTFKGWRYLPLLLDNCIPAPSILARREAWREALPVPESFSFVDWYLNLRIARRFQVIYVPEVVADYRIHSNNQHSNVGAVDAFEKTVLAILDKIFSENDHQCEKKQIRSKVYGQAYRIFASKFMVSGRSDQARRCILQGLRAQPASISFSDLKLFARTLV
jgi:glycosyltransferase involved in cell wall biosynthesis